MNFTQTNVRLTTPPTRTAKQRSDALARANAIRFHRAQVRRDLGARRIALANVIDDPMFATAKVFDVITYLPRYGRTRAFRLLEECGISTGKTCEHITPRQRRDLFAALGPLTQRNDA